jgi:tetratricopeptide (TPR) repeat protein
MQGDEFARRLSAAVQEQDKRFAFFIGAGCSISSGIPAAGPLVQDQWLPRLRDFCAPDAADDDWITTLIGNFDADRPAASYGAVIEQLFRWPEDRQREIERLCDGRLPGFGYAVLAGLMATSSGRLNVALTTNFDDLLSDAMYLFALARPLVIQHDSLAGFIRPTRSRPLVVKLHGDQRLSPMNTSDETARLTEQFEQRVPGILHDRGLIFLGYGGNDDGITNMLSELPPEALPLGVYWVSGSEPAGAIRPWLDRRSAIWVQEPDFDSMMLLFRDAFDLRHPSPERLDDVFARYRQTYERLSNRIVDSQAVEADTASLKDAVARADEAAPTWWGVVLAARRVQRTQPHAADRVFQDGLAKLGEHPTLLGAYANFLADQLHDFARAEEFYARALKVNPTDPTVLSNYAIFLWSDKGDPALAEVYYRRALAANPDNAHALGSYALYVAAAQRDYANAEALFQRALAANPTNADALGNYAGLLFALGEIDRAESLARRAEQAVLEDPHDPVHIEVAFYRLANGPEEGRPAALHQVLSLLEQGVRSPGGELTLNLEAADEAGRTGGPDLRELAQRITTVVEPRATA